MKGLPLFLALGLTLSGCNYNYYQGKQLEAKGRYEEANLSYHRAYTDSPGDDDFKTAYLRTAERTTEDLLIRYQQYLDEGLMDIAYARLEQAKNLTPEHPVVVQELRKWTQVLVAGKVDFTFESLQKVVPLNDEMVLMARINTADPKKVLNVVIDNQTKTFAAEDRIYNLSQKDLIFYTLNSIGVKLKKDRTKVVRFVRFVDLKIPYPKDVNGNLTEISGIPGEEVPLQPVDRIYPYQELAHSSASQDWTGMRGLSYSLTLEGQRIKVESSNGKIDYLPQMLYLNKEERRIFVDFGSLECIQRKKGGIWTFRRTVDPNRAYLNDLKSNLAFSPYFFFREGAYAFVLAQG